MTEILRTAPRIAEALVAGRPVVALETTLVTHGFAHPEGLEIAFELESLVRDGGAEPATIGVLGGQIRVGLTAAELRELAESDQPTKLNPSNLAAVMTAGHPGSTTVAATLLVAAAAGIRVLSTGGIGGVHRDFAQTGDASADLATLARSPVAVVCAGAKAILDLPRTLEALETLGVPVLGVSTDHFPAFYRRSSGLPLDAGFASTADLARAVDTHFSLASGTGVLVANPVPMEYELPEEIYDKAIETALREQHDLGIRGRAVTPYLLRRLHELTEGASAFTNRALLRSNTRLATQLSTRLAR